MDNQNRPTTPSTPANPQSNTKPNAGSIYPEATHGFVGTERHKPAAAPIKKSRLFGFVKAISLGRLIVTVLAIVIVFFAGYQLAVYQEQKGSSLLPHFNIGSQNPCPPGETPEYGVLGHGQLSSNPICLQPGQPDIALKPVIYLYPTHQEQVSVKLSFPAGFRITVPSYSPQTGWQVVAQPNGSLINLKDGKTYPYLFWEGNPAPFHFDMNSGFVVAGSDTKNFLQKQLIAMGLNQNEASSFMAFWLPRMQSDHYNLIHFAGSEYTSYAKLSISPRPDSLLRVFMAFEPLSRPETVAPQSFPVFHRVGFTAIEWGGTKLN